MEKRDKDPGLKNPVEVFRALVELGKLTTARIVTIERHPRRLPYIAEPPLPHEADLLQGRLPLWDEDEGWDD